MQNEYLQKIIPRLEEVSEKVRTSFHSLTKDQLNWKPDANTWSVGEVLEHILITNMRYFYQLEEVINGTHKPNWVERLPLLPAMWGNMLLKSVTPEPTRKTKTVPVFEPVRSELSPEVIDEFVRENEKLMGLIRQTDGADHARTIITSPAARFITYSLKDAINIIANHEERHFIQAKRLMERTDFPSA